ncbi:DUF5362 family protein [Papillibacter cinnamivorans]|uniref:Uncharacterized protein n=1 Tax=Papillibacter cinnamivorans DSM 12816 TaxID=1122930 RepID=A0A1W1Z1L3_9FIRM|nr:DUF5362 family protein [Papillibacter cinnamivorans]SMC42345.1 hypothetical protein SAMN02745168_0867 [Papillibacter cinnamivorans DSM 12816]
MKGLALGLTMAFIGIILVIASMTIWGFARKLAPAETARETHPAVKERLKKLKRAQTLCQIIGIVLIVLGVVTGILLELSF